MKSLKVLAVIVVAILLVATINACKLLEADSVLVVPGNAGDAGVLAVERGALLCATESGNCVESWNGSDVVVYSDAGSTRKYLLDGATGDVTMGSGAATDSKIVWDGNAQDFYVGLDDSADDLIIGLGSTVGTTPAISIDENQVVTLSQDPVFGGTTPTLTIGDGGAEDASLVYDGNAQDFYIALDDSADDLVMGLGSTVGTTPFLAVDENLDLTLCDATASDCDLTFDGNAQDYYIALDDSADDLLIGLGAVVGTTPAIGIDENQAATFTGSIITTLGTENVGSVPTIATATITYTAAAGGTGTLWTVGDGEIWYVHAVYANVTTNWDATGDDALVEIGDGNDADGLLDLDDAELQAADTEGTGAPAGWQGFMSTDTRGAYLANGHGFIYAPSGADETIDYNIDETSGETLAAGQLTAYIVYTRLQ